MALTDFFRINFPYGMKRNENGEWFVFNREYMPLGWNSKEDQVSIHKDDCYGEMPVYTYYKGLTENAIMKIFSEDLIQRDSENKIARVFFYNDKTNPKSSPEYWGDYFAIMKKISQFESKQLVH